MDTNVADELPPTRVAVYQSDDEGKRWRFLSWLTPIDLGAGLCANETVLIPFESRIFALMRTQGEYPCPLYLSWSDDNGCSWSTPQPTGLFGEAPAFCNLPDGSIIVGYRGYRNEDAEAGGTVSLSRFDPKTLQFSPELVVDIYKGNHYDGGYCDLIWHDEGGELLVAYYYCDTPDIRNPGIRCVALKRDEIRFS